MHMSSSRGFHMESVYMHFYCQASWALECFDAMAFEAVHERIMFDQIICLYDPTCRDAFAGSSQCRLFSDWIDRVVDEIKLMMNRT